MSIDEFLPGEPQEETTPAPDIEEPAAEKEPAVEIERGLGFTDGFQFGCGFWAAAVVAAVLLGLGLLALSFLLSFAGINFLV